MPTTKVVLTNRKARLVRPYDYDCLNELLKYRKPGWEYTNAAKFRGWDGYLHLLQRDVVGAGAFLALREMMEREATTRFVLEDLRRPPQFVALPFEEQARDYQKACVEKMIEASSTGGLVLNATGTGKTALTGMYLKRLKGPALFLVDELTLLDQAQKELSKWLGEPVGNIGNQQFNPQRITVATIQTIHRHRFDSTFIPWTKKLQCIIIDELHLALNRSNFQTVAAIQPPVVFGLTATLELKKRHVAYRAYDLCGPVVFNYPLEQGVQEGFLSKGVAIAVQVGQKSNLPAIKGNPRWRWARIRHRMRYQELYNELIVNGRHRNEVLEGLIRTAYGRGKHIIVLLDRIQHLKDLSQKLDGIPHELVYGEVHVSSRVDSKNRFDAGKLRVILTNKVFKKGVDIKKVDVIIDGAAMKSKNDAVQKYGRGVRLCDGKVGLVYFDMADTGNRFEKAAISRRSALKKIGVPVYKVDSDLGPDKILELALKKLDALEVQPGLSLEGN